MSDWWIWVIVVIVGLTMGSLWTRWMFWSAGKGSKRIEDWRRARREK